MNTNNICELSPKKRINKAAWLFLTAALTISSCGTPKSVRTGTTYHNSKSSKTQSEAIATKDDSAQDQDKIFTPKASKNALKSDEKLNDTKETHRRIPTLREQMSLFEDKQNKTSEEVAVLSGRMDDTDKNIAEIKNNMENIKTAIVQLRSEKAKTGAVTDKVVAEKPATKSVDIKPKKNVIMSEEAAKSDNAEEAPITIAPVKQTKPKAAVQTSKKSPEKKTTLKKKKGKATTAEEPKQTSQVEAKTKKTQAAPASAPANTNDELSAAINEIQNKNYGEAINGLQKAETKTKDANLSSDINYYYGEAYSGMKNYQKATAYYSKVAKSKNSAKQIKAQAKLAETLYKAGQTTEARQAYEKIIEKYPKSEYAPVAKKMLQQL